MSVHLWTSVHVIPTNRNAITNRTYFSSLFSSFSDRNDGYHKISITKEEVLPSHWGRDSKLPIKVVSDYYAFWPFFYSKPPDLTLLFSLSSPPTSSWRGKVMLIYYFVRRRCLRWMNDANRFFSPFSISPLTIVAVPLGGSKHITHNQHYLHLSTVMYEGISLVLGHGWKITRIFSAAAVFTTLW